MITSLDQYAATRNLFQFLHCLGIQISYYRWEHFVSTYDEFRPTDCCNKSIQDCDCDREWSEVTYDDGEGVF